MPGSVKKGRVISPRFAHMPGSPKKGTRSVLPTELKNLPTELVSKVLNHASPQSIQTISQVNKALGSMAKKRLAGEIVYYKASKFHPHPYFYKLGLG